MGRSAHVRLHPKGRRFGFERKPRSNQTGVEKGVHSTGPDDDGCERMDETTWNDASTSRRWSWKRWEHDETFPPLARNACWCLEEVDGVATHLDGTQSPPPAVRRPAGAPPTCRIPPASTFQRNCTPIPSTAAPATSRPLLLSKATCRTRILQLIGPFDRRRWHPSDKLQGR